MVLPQILAKDLVRTRNYVTKFIEFRSHLQGVGLKLETVRSHEAMAGAMKDVTKAMVSLNKQVNRDEDREGYNCHLGIRSAGRRVANMCVVVILGNKTCPWTERCQVMIAVQYPFIDTGLLSVTQRCSFFATLLSIPQ